MITKILSKYEGGRSYWYPNEEAITVYKSPKLEEYREGCGELELNLQNKWKSYIPKGWYGFSLGSPCPKDWYKIIDEFLDYLWNLQNREKISGFEIHQIKIKFGGLRFYVSYKCEDQELDEFIRLQIEKLESFLFDEKLIY